jgi:Do/DeqQ family serine protease
MKKQDALLFIFFPLFFIGCQAQINKEKELLDIEQLQKDQKQNNLSTKISYAGVVDFRHAAKIATPGVVHIKSTYMSKEIYPQDDKDSKDFYNQLPDPFKDFFNKDPFFRHFEFRYPESPSYKIPPRDAIGSAVIISTDGYIITNNHVIKNADNIEVITSNRRSYKAELVGADPQTDLALLKIEEKDLQFIEFANSDSLEIGEWVVAVGNPFNLASTVTAGIVSAKARNINILKDQGAIESFIQTDAAVNPGNSGGALVNLEGKLVGINTAIATPTGVYAGYAFAIPSNIVIKVINDLMNYGMVQRGYLGIVIRDLNSELSKELNIDRTMGVYVDSVLVDGAAKKAGIKVKDVIIEIDGIETPNTSKLQELIARKKPGEKVKINLVRDGEKKEITSTLRNKEGSTKLVKKEPSSVLKLLGVELEEIGVKEKREYKVKNGVRIVKLYRGKLSKQTNIKEGFIIMKVNNNEINSIDEFINHMKDKSGGIMLEGKYPNDPFTYYYAFGI